MESLVPRLPLPFILFMVRDHGFLAETSMIVDRTRMYQSIKTYRAIMGFAKICINNCLSTMWPFAK